MVSSNICILIAIIIYLVGMLSISVGESWGRSLRR